MCIDTGRFAVPGPFKNSRPKKTVEINDVFTDEMI
jgi:hypothetical protein